MTFDIGKVFENFVASYLRLPLAQKVAIPALLMASTGVILFVINWANRPEYAVLFSNVEKPDAAAIVESLKDKKVKYEVSGDGDTIKVSPPSMVHELRLEMASLGLPRGGAKGYELFDAVTMFSTHQGEKINKLRAIQGELERTIQSIETVSIARVHITLPEPSAFVKRDTPPTASVLLKLKPGAELTPIQVKGISHLVAGSVERLIPDNVTVMDSNGNLLTQKSEGEDGHGADTNRLDYQRKIEAGYSKRIETMLAEILGPGHAVARVTAELDFSKFEKEEEAYDPAGIVTRSERTIEESAGGKSEGGVPGVVSNLTNDPNLLSAPDSSKGNALRREQVKNFEVSRSVSRTATAAGKITKLSVAVLVDGQEIEVPTATNDENGKPVMEKQYKPLSTDMMRKIENLVKQAVGFDASRGDLVTVENIRFQSDNAIARHLEASAPGFVERWVYPNAIGFFGLIFLWLLVRPLVRFLVTPSESEVDLSRLLPAGVEELEAELEAERSKISVMPDVNVPAVDIEELETLLAENSKFVKENPQQAALLIRYWLNDGRI